MLNAFQTIIILRKVNRFLNVLILLPLIHIVIQESYVGIQSDQNRDHMWVQWIQLLRKLQRLEELAVFFILVVEAY